MNSFNQIADDNDISYIILCNRQKHGQLMIVETNTTLKTLTVVNMSQ